MLKLRKSVPEDIPLILSFIRELAEYERAPNAVSCTETDLRRDGFGANQKFRVIIAEWNGEPAGMAFFFYNYSTWQGRPGIFIEDLFVRPQFRGKNSTVGSQVDAACIDACQRRSPARRLDLETWPQSLTRLQHAGREPGGLMQQPG